MRIRLFPPLLLALALPLQLAAAGELACDQSETTVTASPGGRLAASVQHQVCETASGGVAAAVTVFVGEAEAPLQGERVVAIAVPRNRDEWPRAVWRSASLLEVWVPNFAKVLETRPAYREVTVALKYCGDDPAARARVAQHEIDLKRWMDEVSRWAESRKRDPENAGPRPPRPEEPRVVRRACTDADIPPASPPAPPPPLALAGTTPRCHALPDRAGSPTTVTVVPDGTIWFTEGAGNRIGSMNPDGSGLRQFPLPNPDSSPRIIALGADGNLWFSEHTGNRIGRITPAGEYTGFAIPTPDSQPRAIALGADGNIWFGQFASSRIGRITPGGEITEFVTPTPDSGPRALAAGPDGNIWFSEYRSNRIGRITPHGNITEFTLPRPDSGPGDITAGSDGAMWFVELSGGMDGLRTDGNRVGRITMDGAITEFAMPAGAQSPINIAVGPDLRPWYSRGSTLGRVGADGTVTELALGGSTRAVGLSAGADREPPRRLGNRLWFADGADGRLCYLAFGEQT